jgi:lipopolysaccharide export system protein LptA
MLHIAERSLSTRKCTPSSPLRLMVICLLFLNLPAPAIIRAQSEGASESRQEEFRFQGDSTTIRVQEDKRRTILSGNARIDTGSLTITADTIELYGPDFRYLDCSGDVMVDDREKELTIETKELFYDRKEDYSRIRGYTELLDRKNELSARCYYLEQEGSSGQVLLQVAVKIDTVSDGEAVVCHSQLANYNRNEKELELLGAPLVDWKGDEYRADRIVINTKTDTIRMSGSVSGSLKEESE